MRQNSFSSCTSFAPFAPFLISNDVDGKDGVSKQIERACAGSFLHPIETLNLKKKKENAKNFTSQRWQTIALQRSLS